MTSLRDLQQRAHQTATEKGFWSDTDLTDDVIGNKLMLIVGEVSEAHEALRKGERDWYLTAEGKFEGLPIELADVLIRIFDLAGALDIDLQGCVENKMAYNDTRPYKHGKRF